MFQRCAVLIAVTALVLSSPPAHSALDAPEYLEPESRQAFETWQSRPTERAFALGNTGAWGQAWDHETTEAARQAALRFCHEHAGECRIIAVNDHLVETASPWSRDATGDNSGGWRWAEGMSPENARQLAVLGLFILIGGTLAADWFPLIAPAGYRYHPGAGWRVTRMNYTALAVLFVYFLCLMPLLFRLVPEDDTDVMAWLRFFAPLVPPILAVLYLKWRGKLGRFGP